MRLTLRRATPDEESTVQELQAEAVRWLAGKGQDQWQPGQPRAPREGPGTHLSEAIRNGACWLVETNGEVVATITVDERADPDFWAPAEAPEALYVHRMIVRRDHAGHGIGRLLLDWANELAARAARPLLRLDAWRTNTALHGYYRRQGFEHVRTVDLAHRGSGALFQRPVSRDPAASRLHVASDGASATVTLPSEPRSSIPGRSP